LKCVRIDVCEFNDRFYVTLNNLNVANSISESSLIQNSIVHWSSSVQSYLKSAGIAANSMLNSKLVSSILKVPDNYNGTTVFDKVRLIQGTNYNTGEPYIAIDCFDFTFSKTNGWHIPYGVAFDWDRDRGAEYTTATADLTNTGLQFIRGTIGSVQFSQRSKSQMRYFNQDQGYLLDINGHFDNPILNYHVRTRTDIGVNLYELLDLKLFGFTKGPLWKPDDYHPQYEESFEMEVQLFKPGNYSSHCNVFGNLSFRYTGIKNVTKSGRTCQNWTSQHPHKHKVNNYNFLFALDLGNHNYCRGPNMDLEGAWCFTTDPEVRWEYCSCDYQDGIPF